MEIREAAACGITERRFVLEVEPEDLPDVYRIFLYAGSGAGHYDEEVREDLLEQLSYIVGPAVEEELSEDADVSSMRWQEDDGVFCLTFQETNAPALYRIFQAVDHPGEGFDEALNARLAEEILALAPSLLENLPVINR